MGDRLDAIAVGVVIAINAILGFTLELRARRAMEAVTQLGATRATVMRDGRLTAIDAASLVPGDLMICRLGRRCRQTRRSWRKPTFGATKRR